MPDEPAVYTEIISVDDVVHVRGGTDEYEVAGVGEGYRGEDGSAGRLARAFELGIDKSSMREGCLKSAQLQDTTHGVRRIGAVQHDDAEV
jgi:hypothetical protein